MAYLGDKRKPNKAKLTGAHRKAISLPVAVRKM